VTIAACYLSPEGVVLGADSTSTYGAPGDPHYYNNAQKLFELGQDSTLGAVTWGLGGLRLSSYRTQFALLSDGLKAASPNSVQEVAQRWTAQFWTLYSDPNAEIAPYIAVQGSQREAAVYRRSGNCSSSR
jgi:hypothetical protein